jgi:hypothetical protein
VVEHGSTPLEDEEEKDVRLPAGMPTGWAAGRLDWSTFPTITLSIYLLKETFIIPGQTCRLVDCLPPHRLTVARYSHTTPSLFSPPHYARSGPNPAEATAIHFTLAGRPVKILTAYISPSRPLNQAELPAFFRGGLPVPLAGDLNAKHVDCMRQGKILLDVSDEISHLILKSHTPNTHPYNPSAPPDVLDIVITKEFLSRWI